MSETDCVSNGGMESQGVLLSVEDLMFLMVGGKPRCITQCGRYYVSNGACVSNSAAGIQGVCHFCF